MSYRTIGCALALEDLSIGERLTVFALASYAGRDHRAWPAAQTAAVRAGLSRRQYLSARDRLVARGLVAIEPQQRASSSALVHLAFAEDGPTVGHEINPALFEAVLTHSRVCGGARVLLATLAALAGPSGVVEGFGSEEICEASGLSDRTYRRARQELLAGAELVLEQAGGGRARPNRWRVTDRGTGRTASHQTRQGRAAPAAGQMPLLAVARIAAHPTSRAIEAEQGSGAGGGENPGVNPGQNFTPPVAETPAETPAQTPAETPAETPAPNARAGTEPQNQRTSPPGPPEGGPRSSVAVIEQFTSPRGRRRTRTVLADAAEIAPLTEGDDALWRALRPELRRQVGDSAFEVWFADVSPMAVSTADGAVLLACARPSLHPWVRSRYAGLLPQLAGVAGRSVRFASDRELSLHHAVVGPARAMPGRDGSDPDHQEAI